jgi:hypothetical protein
MVNLKVGGSRIVCPGSPLHLDGYHGEALIHMGVNRDNTVGQMPINSAPET